MLSSKDQTEKRRGVNLLVRTRSNSVTKILLDIRHYSTIMKSQPAVLAILYSKGGLGDVGRHAILAALERDDVASVKVFSEHPETLQETNWKCGCPDDHVLTEDQLKRMEIIKVSPGWKAKDLSSHFEGVTAVVSCLGNRQMFLGERVAEGGSKAVVASMNKHNISRVVAITSVGLGEDVPGCEWHYGGKIMGILFQTTCRREAVDLRRGELTFQDSGLDYLLVRPVGLAENVVPLNEYFIQKEKFKDILGITMAKLDCARFMVDEALNPTRHRTAVVVGSDPEKESK